MEQAPAWFVQALKHEFDDRLRIRWSLANHEWHVEQKAFYPVPPLESITSIDDAGIRAQDGYEFVLTVRPGDRMPCRNVNCWEDLRVPLRAFKEVKCQGCGTVHDVTGFFPLNDQLLQWLRRIDPIRGGTQRVLESVTAKMEKRDRDREREMSNHVEAVTKEYWSYIAGIQSVGYTGNETFGK